MFFKILHSASSGPSVAQAMGRSGVGVRWGSMTLGRKNPSVDREGNENMAGYIDEGYRDYSRAYPTLESISPEQPRCRFIEHWNRKMWSGRSRLSIALEVVESRPNLHGGRV